MTEVKHVKASKDYPEFGIDKGEMYYVWVPGFRARTMRSKTKPRQSQLYQGYKSSAYALNEQIEDFRNPGNLEDLESFRDELVSDAENLRDEEQEKLDNMPDGLREGDTGNAIQERIDAVEAFIDELWNLDFDSKLDDDASDEERTEEADAKFEELTSVSLDVN
jgi:hypothetical protein